MLSIFCNCIALGSLPNGTQLSFATQLLIEMAERRCLLGFRSPLFSLRLLLVTTVSPSTLQQPSLRRQPRPSFIYICIMPSLSLCTPPRRFSTLMMFAEHWSSNLIIRRTYTVLVARFTCTGALKRRTQHSLDTRAASEKNNSFRPRGLGHCLRRARLFPSVQCSVYLPTHSIDCAPRRE